MAVLQTKYVAVGTWTYGSLENRGFNTALSIGTISNTSGGSSNVNLDSVYTGADVYTCNYSNDGSNENVVLILTGNRANSGWATMTVGSYSYSRTAATYSYSSSNNQTTWIWSSTNINPFGTSGNVAVEWDDGGSVTPPDDSINTISNQSIDNSATSFSITIGNGGSTTVYEVRTSSYTGTVVGSRTGNGTLTVNNVPPDNSSRTYYLTCRLPVANGGNNSSSNIQTFSVTTTATPTYSISVSPTTVAGSDTITATWSTNQSATYYYNSAHFGSGTLGSGTSGTKVLTANNSFTGSSATSQVTMRTVSTSGSIKATSQTVTIYKTPGTPSVSTSNVTTSSFTATATAGSPNVGTLQVSINGSTWFTSPRSFTGLSSNTQYTVYARQNNNNVGISGTATTTVTTSQQSATLDLGISLLDRTSYNMGARFTGDPVASFTAVTYYYSYAPPATISENTTVRLNSSISSYEHKLTGCGADTIYYASYTAGTSQGNTTTYSNLSPIGRTFTTASTRILHGMTGAGYEITAPAISSADTVYIWAVLNPNSPGGSTIGNSTTMTYTGTSFIVERPDTTISLTPSATTLPLADQNDVTVDMSGYGTNSQYRLYSTDLGSGRWISTRTNSATDFLISYDEDPSGSSGGVEGAGTGQTELPTTSNTPVSYFAQVRMLTSAGAEERGTGVSNHSGAGWQTISGSTFNISRSSTDLEPTQFDLGANATNVSTGTDATSNQITIAGLSTGASASFSVTNTSWTKVAKNGTNYNLTSGTVVNGDTLQVQITASSSSGTTLSTTLSVGSPAVTDSWSVTTASSGTGSPGGNTGAVTGGTFGLAIHKANDTSSSPPVVLDQNNRTNNVIVSGTAAVGANSGTTITCPGMTTNNHSEVGAMIKMSFISNIFTITRGTGEFTINNTSSTSFNVPYIAFRWG